MGLDNFSIALRMSRRHNDESKLGEGSNSAPSGKNEGIGNHVGKKYFTL